MLNLLLQLASFSYRGEHPVCPAKQWRAAAACPHRVLLGRKYKLQLSTPGFPSLPVRGRVHLGCCTQRVRVCVRAYCFVLDFRRSWHLLQALERDAEQRFPHLAVELLWENLQQLGHVEGIIPAVLWTQANKCRRKREPLETQASKAEIHKQLLNCTYVFLN